LTDCEEMTKPKKHDAVGNAYFMAPEMAAYKPYGKPVDIWAIGVCVLEMLLGKSPLRKWTGKGGRLKSMFEVATSGYPRPLFEEDGESNWTIGVKEFLDACLETDPEKRATADQLLAHPWLASACSTKECKKYCRNAFMQTTIEDIGF